MHPKLIVFDSNDLLANHNKIFDPEYSNAFGRSTWVEFYKLATERGIKVITSDLLLKTDYNDRGDILLISEMVTPRTIQLIETHGAIPLVCFCWESPNVAWNFYFKLEEIAQNFMHLSLFEGVRSKVKSPSVFHPVYWPNTPRPISSNPKWKHRDYLVMVVSNKHRFAVSQHKPGTEVRQWMKQLLWWYLQLSDPLLRFPDLYYIRLKAILYFINVEGFKLYGTGWEKPKGLKRQTWQAIQAIKPRPVDNKLQTLSNYKFTLCFENCIFSGYLTEKIFDAFFAGCIPIYLGAPDINDLVPSGTFIDFRNFQDFSELNCFLSQMSEEEAKHYLNTARDFLNSSAFDKFTDQQNALEMFNIID